MLKKILRYFFLSILYTLAGVLVLLVSLFFIIRIPAVQNKLITVATHTISDKTNTVVTIGEVGISLPKSVYLKNIYLEDTHKDTLLSAGFLFAEINLTDLLDNKIHIRQVKLENTYAYISRATGDSLYNFDFLIKAFSGNKAPSRSDSSKSTLQLQVDEVLLSKCNFHFLDSFGQVLINVSVNKLHVNTEKTDIKNLEFKVGDLLLKDAMVSVKIPANTVRVAKSEKSRKNPVISVADLELINVAFKFDQVPDSISLTVSQVNLKLKDARADLDSFSFRADKLNLKDCITTFSNNKTVQTESKDTLNRRTPDLNIHVGEIRIQNNFFSYSDNTKPMVSGFDPAHFALENIQTAIEKAAFHNGEITGSVKTLSLYERKGFTLKHLSGKLAYLTTGIQLDELKLQTQSSNISGDLRIGFSSIGALKENISETNVAIDLKESILHSADLVYFIPKLKDAPYLSSNTPTVIEAVLSGKVGMLQGKKLKIHAGKNTSFYSSFLLKGLPDLRKAVLLMPDGQLNTSKNDLMAFLPEGTIPETIDLPNEIQTKIDFSGSLEQFKSQVNLFSDFGNASVEVEFSNKNTYTAEANLMKFNAGRLLRKTDLLGEMSLSVQADGSGFTFDSLLANITIHADEISFNKYVYHNLDIQAKAEKRNVSYTIAIQDTSIALQMHGAAGLQTGMESFSLDAAIKGINLYNLHFTDQDFRLAAELQIDLQRDPSTHQLKGQAALSKMTVITVLDKFFIDTALTLSINQQDLKNINKSTAFAALHINGIIDPAALPKSFTRLVNNYFFIAAVDTGSREQDFEFRLQLNNHPVIQGALFKDLRSFRADDVTGRFRSKDNELVFHASLSELNYTGIIASNANINIGTDTAGLKISLEVDQLESNPVKLNKLHFNTLLHNQQAEVSISSGEATADNKLAIKAVIHNKDLTGYRINLTTPVTLNSFDWNIPADNSISFSNRNFTLHHLELENNDQIMSLQKERVDGDLLLRFKNFEIGSLTRILNRDTILAEGKLDGTLSLKQGDHIIADLQLDNFRVKSQEVGNIRLTASSQSRNIYKFNSTLTGRENDAEVSGIISVDKGNPSLDLESDIRKLNLKSIEPFTRGQIHESDGFIHGKLTVTGSPENPIIEGDLHFTNVSAIPSFTNNKIFLKNEHISITHEHIRFPSVVIRDKDDHTATLTGEIRKKGFTDLKFDLRLVTSNFTFLNTTKKDNPVFYGLLLADCDAKITGDLLIPRINAAIHVKKRTHFVFAVQQNLSSTDKGEGVIVFMDSTLNSPILDGPKSEKTPKSAFKGMDITANVKIDPQAVLTIIVDPVTGDSLTVKGDAALSFALDEGGKISLTGRYELTDGSYLVTLQQLIHRKFAIQKGSTITWNGDPLDADVDMTAIYKVNTSPADLIINEVGAASEEELKSYRQRLPFEVHLLLKDKLLTPDITFSIELPEAYRGAMGGVVNSKLNLLKEDPSELNKQVFALLILKRFIQQDPFTSASGSGAESVARMSVGKFLSQELNNLSARYIKGVELNVDVQSYENATQLSGSGTTEVEVGVKKEFFNERLSVQVGGSIDVEGAGQKSDQSNDLTGNVIIEYKLTPDGRYRLKGFRQNEYGGFIEGQLIETGIGIIYSWDFGKWKEITTPPRKDDER